MNGTVSGGKLIRIQGNQGTRHVPLYDDTFLPPVRTIPQQIVDPYAAYPHQMVQMTNAA